MPTGSTPERNAGAHLEPPTRFIGRSTDLARLEGLFDRQDRLVTLWGPPGIGKPRLALRYAGQTKGAGADAIVCDLTTVANLDELVAVQA